MTLVVDYGMGNLGSVLNMIRRLGEYAEVSSDPHAVRHAQRLILPGVGSFGRAMTNLHERGLVAALSDRVLGDGVPILGVCLGMQLLTRGSAESPGIPGLGWVDADTVPFEFEPGRALRVPHMGWNTVRWVQQSPLAAPEPDARFYFVHSYHVRCDRPENVLATATYGAPFHAAVVQGNISGTQFHPEKSHRFGMGLMQRFLASTVVAVPS